MQKIIQTTLSAQRHCLIKSTWELHSWLSAWHTIWPPDSQHLHFVNGQFALFATHETHFIHVSSSSNWCFSTLFLSPSTLGYNCCFVHCCRRRHCRHHHHRRRLITKSSTWSFAVIAELKVTIKSINSSNEVFFFTASPSKVFLFCSATSTISKLSY